MARGPAGKPLAVVSFADEEGGRFNTPTFGSRLLTGALAPEAVLDRVDGDGVTLAAAISDSGLAPGELGRDGALLERLEGFVELHIEQGSLLGPRGRPVGIATAIIPHGRWRITLTGEANHGGTAAMETRRDPMLPLAEVLRAGRRVAEEEDSLVTVGKVEIWPNAPTSIAERVTAWLDVRSEREEALEAIVEKIARAASASASAHRVDFALEPESRTPEVRFSAPLAARITEALARVGLDPVPMSTGAGHDAGVLAAVMPTAMLFVRNETGISHSRAESARREDCLTGIGALVSVLDELRDTPRPATSTPNGEARS
jgi:N-carbamoyl-L-amino-acid hydrolase